MQNSGTPLIVAAVILAAAVLGAALIMKSSMDAGTAQLEGVRGSLVEFKDALAAAARPSAPAAQRPSGPDPARKYSVNLNGTPVKGVQTAKVTLVEFSDFQ